MKRINFEPEKIQEKFEEFLRDIRDSIEHRAARFKNQKLKRVLTSWERALKRFLPLGGMSSGNFVELFFNGDDLFEDLVKRIDDAVEHVWLETYILKDDLIGKMVRDALLRALSRGCEVILIYDYFGSQISRGYFQPLLQTGAKVHPFNPIWAWRRRGPLMYRDHRKIIIVDDKYAYCGGMNISEEYAGKRLGSNKFSDAHMRIEGPAVRDLSALFLETLGETTGEIRELKLVNNADSSVGIPVQVLASNTRRNIKTIQQALEEALNHATDYCHLVTPYFLPLGSLRKAILDAAHRGVDVKIMTSGMSDVPPARRGGQYVYEIFLRSGIQIFELFSTVLHAKTVTVDGVFASVGSFNLDHWSDKRNLEVTVCMFNKDVAEQLENQFEQYLPEAKEIKLEQWKKRPWYLRLLQWVCYKLWI